MMKTSRNAVERNQKRKENFMAGPKEKAPSAPLQPMEKGRGGAGPAKSWT